MGSLISGLTDPVNITAMVVAAMVFATIVTLASPLLKTDKLDVRMKAVANRREELRRVSRAALNSRSDAGAALRRTDESWYKKVVDQLNLAKLIEDPKVVDKLSEAGLRGPSALSRFYFFRFATPFVFAAFAGFYVVAINHNLLPIQRMCAVVVAFVAGFYGPNLWVSNMASKRRNSIVQAFPDALDLLLICVESGMSIEAAIAKVAGEIGTRSIELAEELSLLNAELSYLPERRQAYEGLAQAHQAPRHQGGGRGHDPVRTLRHASRQCAPRHGQGEPRHADRLRREEGRSAAGEAHRADGAVLSAGDLHRDPDSRPDEGLRQPR